MKKLFLLLFAAIIAVCFSGCGPHMYKSYSAGQNNASYIIVLTQSSPYHNVDVVVDDVVYPYGKVYKVKAKRKAHPITIEPGKHDLKVLVDGVMVKEEKIFIGLQETKIITL